MSPTEPPVNTLLSQVTTRPVAAFSGQRSLLYCCFTATLLLFYCCFTAALMLLQCCFNAASMLLYCFSGAGCLGFTRSTCMLRAVTCKNTCNTSLSALFESRLTGSEFACSAAAAAACANCAAACACCRLLSQVTQERASRRGVAAAFLLALLLASLLASLLALLRLYCCFTAGLLYCCVTPHRCSRASRAPLKRWACCWR